MYHNRNGKWASFTILYYIIFMIGLGVSGYLRFVMGVNAHNWIYGILVLGGAGAAVFAQRDGSVLGLPQKWKRNGVWSLLIVALTMVVGLLFSEHPLKDQLRLAAYYLFWIALAEEILFRGFIQNGLFGLKLPSKVLFLIGAVMFAFMHIPFQMFRNGDPSFSYILTAAPQLLFTAGFHLVMCWIARKRGDILLPVAIHFAVDYLQNI